MYDSDETEETKGSDAPAPAPEPAQTPETTAPADGAEASDKDTGDQAEPPAESEGDSEKKEE